MTTFQLCLVVALVVAVLFATGIALMHVFSSPLDWLSADASLDTEPYQPRASTLHEPSSAELLLCAAVVVFVIAVCYLLWDGFSAAMAGWMAERVVAMHPH